MKTNTVTTNVGEQKENLKAQAICLHPGGFWIISRTLFGMLLMLMITFDFHYSFVAQCNIWVHWSPHPGCNRQLRFAYATGGWEVSQTGLCLSWQSPFINICLVVYDVMQINLILRSASDNGNFMKFDAETFFSCTRRRSSWKSQLICEITHPFLLFRKNNHCRYLQDGVKWWTPLQYSMLGDHREVPNARLNIQSTWKSVSCKINVQALHQQSFDIIITKRQESGIESFKYKDLQSPRKAVTGHPWCIRKHGHNRHQMHTLYPQPRGKLQDQKKTTPNSSPTPNKPTNHETIRMVILGITTYPSLPAGFVAGTRGPSEVNE